jgi:hypothetical protein
MTDWARSLSQASGLEYDPIAYCGSRISCAAGLDFRSCRKIQARRPYSPSAAGRRQSLVEDHVRSHRKARLQHSDTHGCMHAQIEQTRSDTTRIANDNREDQPAQIRLFVGLTRVPNCLRQYKYKYSTSPLSEAAHGHACTFVQ